MIGYIGDIDYHSILQEYSENEIHHIKDSMVENFEVLIVESLNDRVVEIIEGVVNKPSLIIYEDVIRIDHIDRIRELGFYYAYLPKSRYEEIDRKIKRAMEQRRGNWSPSPKYRIYAPEDLIEYIEFQKSERKTCVFLENNEKIFLSRSLREVEDELGRYSDFFRVDRSTIVNLSKIKYLNLEEEFLKLESGVKLYFSSKVLKKLP